MSSSTFGARQKLKQLISETVNDTSTDDVDPAVLLKGVADQPHGKLYGGSRINVKGGSEQYSTKTYVGKHVKSGEPVEFQGRQVETVSDRDFAKMGAYLKHVAQQNRVIDTPLTEHEKSLVNEMYAKDTWCGKAGSEWLTDIPGKNVKAVLDETGGSGGREVNPIFFDSAIVTFPLLSGELFPYVDVRDVPRSSRVEGASISTPTLTWGSTEGSAFSLFTTTSMVAAIDTSIFSVVCGVEFSRDLLSDAAPLDLGQTVGRLIGERLAYELDNQIANGDGSQEPEGIFTASGLGSVSSTNGTSGALVYNDALNMIFGIAKQYRTPAMRPVFVGPDSIYQQFKAITTGVTGDTRPVYGMDVKSYMLNDYDFKVQNDIDSNSLAFGVPKKYRLYRRLGFQLEMHTQGQTLALKNTAILVFRARYGGQIVDSSAWATMTDASTS